jgi:hypothetical protein
VVARTKSADKMQLGRDNCCLRLDGSRVGHEYALSKFAGWVVLNNLLQIISFGHVPGQDASRHD